MKVVHQVCGPINVGAQSEVGFVSDGNAFSGAVLPGDFGAFGDYDHDVRTRDCVRPGFDEEGNISEGAVKDVTDFHGMFVEGADVKEDALQGLGFGGVVAGGLRWVLGLSEDKGVSTVAAGKRSVGVNR